MALSRPEEEREASTAALGPRTTGADAFPYTPRWKICRQRLIGWNTLEARQSSRPPKYREAPSWPCLPIPQAISRDFLWGSRPANDDAKSTQMEEVLQLCSRVEGQ